MGENIRIAVCLANKLNGQKSAINFLELEMYLNNIPEVVNTWYLSDILSTDLQAFTNKVKEGKINRIIIAGEKPGFVKDFICSAFVLAGNNPDHLILADFTEYCDIDESATERAKVVLLCAVSNIPFEIATGCYEASVLSDTLVIGGGIAGIQASLEIANGGYNVFLLEKSGTIGGHMAMFDKTFPTLDCAACILTPKMVEVGQHENIDLITYSEIKEINGIPGNYKVRILKKARRVNLSTCIGCGTCAEKCPSKVPSEFDHGTTLRKAIYMPFPQAVPNKYLIDADNCTYVQKGKCGVCIKFCPVVDCINLDEKDEEIEISVGNIIVATGFKTFDASRATQFGYGAYPNVLTSLEFERLINASGPTGGKITMASKDKKGNRIFTNESPEPKRIAVIHCVGSRDENYNKYCSRVCCMYSLKLAHLVKEKLPDAEVYEHYIDMRSFGKGYEEFYNRIKNEGIKIIRGKTAKVTEKRNNLVIRSEDILEDKLIELEVDMVILAVGLEPREDAKELARLLNISTDNDGWLSEHHYLYDSVSTDSGGIFIAGACQGPKDIPDTVAQGSAAASKVLQSIAMGKAAKGVNDISTKQVELKIKEFKTI